MNCLNITAYAEIQAYPIVPMSSISSPSSTTLAGSELFSSVYGGQPELSVKAPGRINLIGEHVDYQGGLVMPAAIDRYVFGMARGIPEAEVRLSSAGCRGKVIIPLDQKSPLGGDDRWANYAFGVVAKYRDAGHPVVGFEASFDANLPLGAGMSSSAALESATAMILEGLLGINLAPTERALLCQSAEHDWAGVPCGIMDQIAVNAGLDGHALMIDCRSLEISPVSLPSKLAIVVVDSKVKHALADGEYAKRKADCEAAAKCLGHPTLRDVSLSQLNAAKDALGDRVYRRARHVVTEIARVGEFSKALDSGSISLAGSMMAGSHHSLRDDFGVSCAELDALVEIARELGAIGSRMMGGGFGGSTVNLVARDGAENFAEKIVARYRELHGAEVEAFVVNPVGGASREVIK